MTLATLPERAGRFVVTSALVLFAVWTLVYQAALFTGFPATPSLVVAALLGVGALVGLSRLDRDGTEHPLAWPGAAAALAVVAVAVVATGLALAELRLAALALGVVAALVALVMSSRWAPRLEARRLARRSPDAGAAAPAADDGAGTPETDLGGPGTARWLWGLGWVAALGSGALASILATPDGDDAYFVNLSTWVAERGHFPLRDTMISSDVFPAISGALTTHPLRRGADRRRRGRGGRRGRRGHLRPRAPAGHRARRPRAHPPGRRGGHPRSPAALLATVAYLWTAGRSGYGLGGFFAVRIWQGKAMLVSVVLPLVFLYGSKIIRQRQGAVPRAVRGRPGREHRGVQHRSVPGPALVAGLVLGAVALGEWRGTMRLALWSIYPVVMAVLSVVLARGGDPTSSWPARASASGR